MSTTKTNGKAATEAKGARRVDLKLEVVPIRVSDIDRAKRFYEHLGWRLDADFIVGNDFRGLQFTPPGSPASIHFGKNAAASGPPPLFLVVSDIEAARRDLIGRGVEVSEIFHGLPGEAPKSGRHPEGRTYASYATFKDPDGNAWLLQEVTARLPGRIDDGETSFASPSDLAHALRRAATAHGEHEKRIGKHDAEGWPEWYAEYLAAEQAGKALPV